MRVRAVFAGGMASDTGTPWGLFGRLCESHEEVSILVLFLCVCGGGGGEWGLRDASCNVTRLIWRAW